MRPYLARRRRSRGGGVLDPASLFSDGQAGLWLDPQDLSSLWQDSTGTIPATTSGQTIGRISDKSGNGNHFIQADGVKEPAYQTGTIDFDQVDDWIGCGAPGPGIKDLLVAIERTGDPSMAFMSAYGTGAYFGITQASGSAAHAPEVAPTYRINGVAVPGGTATTRQQLLNAWPLNTTVILEVLGLDLNTFTGLGMGFYSGFAKTKRMKGLILRATMTETERTKTRRWLASQAGVTL